MTKGVSQRLRRADQDRAQASTVQWICLTCSLEAAVALAVEGKFINHSIALTFPRIIDNTGELPTKLRLTHRL